MYSVTYLITYQPIAFYNITHLVIPILNPTRVLVFEPNSILM